MGCARLRDRRAPLILGVMATERRSEPGGPGAGASPLAEGDEAALRRIRALPEVVRWWDVPEDGFPWDEPESTRMTIEIDGAVAGLIHSGRSPSPSTATPVSTCSSIRPGTDAGSAPRRCAGSCGTSSRISDTTA